MVKAERTGQQLNIAEAGFVAHSMTKGVRMLRKIALSLLVALTLSGTTMAADIKVLAPNAAKEAVVEAASGFEQSSGHKVLVTWLGTEA
jgi:purine-cytosine permease-like protein